MSEQLSNKPNNAILYGISAFEGIRAIYNPRTNTHEIRSYDAHIKRLIASYKYIDNSCNIDYAKLRQTILDYGSKHKQIGKDLYIRPCLINPAMDNLSVRVAKSSAILEIYHKQLSSGTPPSIKVMTSLINKIPNQISPSQYKLSANYLNIAIARNAICDEFDDVLFLNQAGNLCEIGTANLFIVQDNILHTPSIDCDILPGITRQSILDIAQIMGIKILERKISYSELGTAQEVFCSGSLMGILSVAQIDAIKFSTTQVCSMLQEELQNNRLILRETI